MFLLRQITVGRQRSTLRSWNDAVGCLIFSGKKLFSLLDSALLPLLQSLPCDGVQTFPASSFTSVSPPQHGDDDIKTGQRCWRLSLLSSLKANIRQHLHHSFVFRCTRRSAGCTLIKHASVFFFFFLLAKFYLLGSILFGASLFWLLSKHNYVVVITLFHAAQELLKCLTFFFSPNRLNT